jgi:crotonobetainyl-CoA:carnitine CoA-transferase CaiB-like acyl-CoA transferase
MEGKERPPITAPLEGLRVVEMADEKAEYCGLLLAGLGADVIKIEAPGGNSTRRIGPFYQDEENIEKSLFFWNYNRGKRSVVLDLEQEADRVKLEKLLSRADVFLESTPKMYLNQWGFDGDSLLKRYPTLIPVRITDFGDTGPWSGFKGSDLVHLALGGVMMCCGYDKTPEGEYDLAPIAPQMWHAYHITGEQAAVGILAALIYRYDTRRGQKLDVAVHECVSKNTEVDLMYWIMRHVEVQRQTCRHASEKPSIPSTIHTKDGRWVITSMASKKSIHDTLGVLDNHGMADDLTDVARAPVEAEALTGGRPIPGSSDGGHIQWHVMDLLQRFAKKYSFDNIPWQEAQAKGLLWAPLYKPHENAGQPHWQERKTFTEIWHPELGRSFTYPTSKWLSTETEWKTGRRAPLLNEDADSLPEAADPAAPLMGEAKRRDDPSRYSKRGKPFILDDVKIVDFGWFLASAGGSRFLAAMGAESVKIEYKTNPDTRFGAMAPVGGREAREKATGPIPGEEKDPNMGGQFNNKNPGKRGLSLNVRSPEGMEIVKELVAKSEIVAEGFSPGVLEKWGLGYDALKEINPGIIVTKQSGMGTKGTYGRMRTVGPIAAAFSGLAELSGLPEPAMPVSWGYSYLDWIGAYSFALSMLSALFYKKRTGLGQYIDASQTESGIFLTGVSILDWSANKRVTPRTGNRSYYKKAAPSGAYRCAGEDRWLAVSCFTQEEWQARRKVAGNPAWGEDPRFATLEDRRLYPAALDKAMSGEPPDKNEYELMFALQAAGVAAGVCQTAGDRCDRDPQLQHLEWLTEVEGTKIGRWPVIEVPVKFSETPTYAGGRVDRGAPCYGEDNEYVVTQLLGKSKQEYEELVEKQIF